MFQGDHKIPNRGLYVKQGNRRETGEKKIRRTAYFLDTLFEFDIVGGNPFLSVLQNTATEMRT
jgi:hypothetical protein